MRQLKAVVRMRKSRGLGCEKILVLGLVWLLAAYAIAAETPINPDTLPMFGQPKIARSDSQKQADQAFIRDNTLRYKNRQAASNAFASQGWTAVRARQLDAAMLRFNHAWLLNPKNYSAFLGIRCDLERARQIIRCTRTSRDRARVDRRPNPKTGIACRPRQRALGVRRPSKAR